MGRSDTYEQHRRYAPAPVGAETDIDWEASGVVGLLREAGLRPTPARRWIVALLRSVRVHPTVDELQRLLHDLDHEIRQATLYQSLAKLADAGVVSSFVDGQGLLRFDANVGTHPHLICTSCGRIADLEPSRAEERRIGGLAADLTRDHAGWLVAETRIELRALCPACADRG